MKKLKLLIAACLLGAGAYAQCAASFTSVVNPANNGQVSFTSTSIVLPYALYYYDFGDGNTSGSTWSGNVSHTYASGMYTVCLTLTDSLGVCTSTFCDSIFVNNTLPSCNAYFIATDSVVNTVQVNNYSSGTGLTYFWDMGDGNTSTNSSSMFAYTYANPGVYNICLTVTNAGATCTDTYCDTVFLSSCHAGYGYVPDASGNGYTFTSTSNGTADTYFWDFGDGDTAQVQNPYHVYANNGGYYACLTVSSTTDSTCSDTQCQYIYANGNCQASFYASADSMNIANIYNYSAGGSITYLWDFGDGNTSTSPNITSHQYAAGGTYIMCLTVTNAATSCSSTMCDTLSLSSCTAGYYAVADTSGNGVSFTSITSGSPDTYFWDFGDGNTSTLANPYHVYSSSGYYTACLTVSSTVDSSCSANYCNTVLAGSVCSAMFYIVQDSSNLYNYSIYNNAYSSGTITSWLWSWGDSTTSNTQYPVHTYNWSIPYQICLTITSSNGCTATHCDSIWPGHGVNQVATVTVLPGLATGVAEQAASSETLENYPNPFTGSTTISYTITQNTPVELSISDLLGNKIAVIETGNKTGGTYKTEFDASGISSGIYLLQLKTDTKLSVKKLVIAQ